MTIKVLDITELKKRMEIFISVTNEGKILNAVFRKYRDTKKKPVEISVSDLCDAISGDWNAVDKSLHTLRDMTVAVKCNKIEVNQCDNGLCDGLNLSGSCELHGGFIRDYEISYRMHQKPEHGRLRIELSNLSVIYFAFCGNDK